MSIVERSRWSGVAVALALLGAACSSGGEQEAAGPASDIEAAPSDRTCGQGATQDEVEAEPVADIPNDLTVTSFDGTEIRAHWFPASGTDPAPTVLMGPGWSLAGDTSQDGAPLFGALGIGALNEQGYNVLTWDPRGFGASTGTATVNHPDLEGRDVQILLDWVAAQPEALTDGDGDPRAGMVGFSYGGGIQLTVAAIDCRVDALVPGLAWHSLETSLYKGSIVKTGWANFLMATAAGGSVDPHTQSAISSGQVDGTISDEDLEWFVERGPGDAVDDVAVPTLFIQGTTDTLFTLDEAVTNFRSLRERDVPTKMLWFCGGHGTCLTDTGAPERVGEASFAWLDRHLKGLEDVDTGPVIDLIDQEGDRWTGADYPPEAGPPVTAEGTGTLALEVGGGSGPVTVPGSSGSPLDALVPAITPAPAAQAVEVPVRSEADVLVVGAPRLSLTYRGTVPQGDAPTRVFAQLVDDERDVVVGNQVTPVEVTLDGESHEVEVELEIVAQQLRPGATLTLQLVATTVAYALPRLGGEVTFERIAVELPTANDLIEG